MVADDERDDEQQCRWCIQDFWAVIKGDKYGEGKDHYAKVVTEWHRKLWPMVDADLQTRIETQATWMSAPTSFLVSAIAWGVGATRRPERLIASTCQFLDSLLKAAAAKNQTPLHLDVLRLGDRSHQTLDVDQSGLLDANKLFTDCPEFEVFSTLWAQARDKISWLNCSLTFPRLHIFITFCLMASNQANIPRVMFQLAMSLLGQFAAYLNEAGQNACAGDDGPCIGKRIKSQKKTAKEMWDVVQRVRGGQDLPLSPLVPACLCNNIIKPCDIMCTAIAKRQLF